MTDPTIFEQQLASGLDQLAGPRRPIDAMAIARRSAAAPTRGRSLTLARAVAVAVVGVFVVAMGVALFGLLDGSTLEEPVPAASTTPVEDAESPQVPAFVSLPSELPDGVRSGALDTPLGPARWVHLRGTARQLPDLDDFGIVRVADRYLLESSNGNWSSPDLVTWTRFSLDSDLDGIGRTADAHWFRHRDPELPLLYRTVDPAVEDSFIEVDLSVVAAMRPLGLDWDRLAYDAVLDGTNGRAILPVRWEIDDPQRLFGLDDRLSSYAPLEDGRIELFDFYERVDPVIVRAETTSDGLRLVDAEDGHVVGEAVGLEPIHLDQWAQRRDLYEQGVVVIDQDGEISASIIEWARDGDPPAFLMTPDGLRAYRRTAEDTVEVRALTDDGEWALVDILGDGPDEPGPVEAVRGYGDRVQLANDDVYWNSVDGVTWDTSDEQSEPDMLTAVGTVEIRGRDATKPDTLRYIAADGARGDIDISALRRGRRIAAGADAVGRKKVQVSAVESIGENAFSLSVRAGNQLDLWIIAFDIPEDAST